MVLFSTFLQIIGLLVIVFAPDLWHLDSVPVVMLVLAVLCSNTVYGVTR